MKTDRRFEGTRLSLLAFCFMMESYLNCFCSLKVKNTYKKPVEFYLTTRRYIAETITFHNAVKPGRHELTFQRNVSPPSSELKSKPNKNQLESGSNYSLFNTGSLLDYLYETENKDIHSSETSMNFYRTARNYIPEDKSAQGNVYSLSNVQVLRKSLVFIQYFRYCLSGRELNSMVSDAKYFTSA
jgi:hypothetical protein